MQLLFDAFDILAAVGSTQADAWCQKFSNFTSEFNGHRNAIRERIRQHLLAVGGSDDLIDEFAASLMAEVDDYSDKLPLVRRVQVLQPAEGDEVEQLACRIYELSAGLGEDLGDHTWGKAPDDVREVLRHTAEQLLSSGLVDDVLYPKRTITVESLGDALRERVQEAMAHELGSSLVARESPYEGKEAPPIIGDRPSSFLPPSIPMPAGFRPGEPITEDTGSARRDDANRDHTD